MQQPLLPEAERWSHWVPKSIYCGGLLNAKFTRVGYCAQCIHVLCSMYCFQCTVFNVLCSCGFTDTDGLIQAGEMARRRRSQSRSRRSSCSSWGPPTPLVEPNIRSCHASDNQQTLVDAQCKFVVIIIICITFHLPLNNFFNFFRPFLSSSCFNTFL